MTLKIWNNYNPVKIFFSRGSRSLIAHKIKEKKVLIVCSSRGRKKIEKDYLLNKAFSFAKNIYWIDNIEPNPDLKKLQILINGILKKRFDCIVALGGGSVIDSAKTFALSLSTIGRKFSLKDLIKKSSGFMYGSSIPLYTIPTTAGTGSEVTPYATIWDYNKYKKYSLSGDTIYPNCSYLDSDLIDSLPYESTIFTGLDAINQSIESILNKNMTPISEVIAQKALVVGLKALPKLSKNLNDKKLRDEMTQASVLSGFAISQTRTSLCHAISYPLTLHFNIPHGLACAFTMSSVLEFSLNFDDGRLKRLSNIISNKKNNQLKDLLHKFYKIDKEFQIAYRVRSIIGSLTRIYEFIPEMKHVGRSNNSIFKANQKNIKMILDKSWNK